MTKLSIYPPYEYVDTRSKHERLIDAIEENINNLLSPYLAPKELSVMLEDITRSIRYDKEIRDLLND